MPEDRASAIQDPRPGQVSLRRKINEEAGPIFQHGDDLCRHFLGDGRTAVRGAHHSVFAQDPLADIRRAMDHDISSPGMVIETFFQTVDPKRQPVSAEIGIPRDKETQTALTRFECVRKGAGIFLA